ncbi:ATP phosphoribosyltransferase [Chloropicon primus]|uniref:ATP phosphoribosyltransferase n=1 Tax=Chloropicon primus TaxID=1764295 RepID=A0A5B8MEJ6_9CHLO|nr:ATP phosphoribosyltransferase [Chloropicon primus]|mmetsp:Transcript_6738/g.19719  ORF Transcript_6738/g.19719 Transcript_6738/m.19719 type:complete len:409 (-) Transcript_6738:69-1295(-)|eukprot:QDZ18863.1 ATP phosphoribosyltransferase [Chloropicon primus]
MSARQVTRAKASTVWCSAGVPSRRVATWPARGNATSLHGRGNVLVPGRHGGVLVAKAKAASAEGSKAGLTSPLRTGPPRLALPSKGRMAEDTLSLLKSCQLAVRKPNPRQYVAEVPNLPGLEVWFQRASDIVRRLNYGDVDIGFIGYDMFHEFADGNDDLVIVHDALRYGGCHLALGVPTKGDFASVHSMEDLKGMGWSKENPLKVVTGYHNTAKAFFAENGMADSVTFLAADGALEAAPYMGCADIILDLVSTGTTLRENNLREIIGGRVIESEGIMVASKRALKERPGLLEIVKQILERLEAHLTAEEYFYVTTNIRADSEAEIAKAMLDNGVGGLQGPTVSRVFSSGLRSQSLFAASVCVRKKNLHDVIKTLRQMGGTGVLVSELTYIFDEEPWRWTELLKKLEE